MSYRIEVLSDLPVIWVTWGAGYEPKTDTPRANREQQEILDAAQEPMAIVVDMRSIKPSWDDIMYLSNGGDVAQQGNSSPNLKASVLITTDEVVAAVSQKLQDDYKRVYFVASANEAWGLAEKLLA